MSTSNMNFGPEWMRRLSRANSNQSLESLGQMNAQAGLTSADQPYSPDGGSFASPFTNGNNTGANQAFNSSYSSITGKQKCDSAQQKTEVDATLSDSLNPFNYSKEMMLSLYRPTEAPLDFERHEYVCSDETLPPMAHYPLTEAESALLATGQINSIARRNPAAPYPNSGSSRGDRNREANSGRGRAARPQTNKTTAPTASNPWPGATKNSIGTFGADGMFRLDGVSDILLESRDFDPRAERYEAEMQSQQLAYTSTANQDELGGLAYGTSNNQALFDDESIPIDPSGMAPRTGRGSLKNILAGLAGFDIDNPEAPVGPSRVSNWFYKDPTNATQGPFSGFDMHEWYKLGYFTGDLLVRREEESSFEPLAILISRVDDEDKPFLTPPRAAHLRTILTPRSARGFLNQGYESEHMFMDQSRMSPFYPEVLSKEALFQEAALYQAQQERHHYLQMLQREQAYQMANGYNYMQDPIHNNYPASPLPEATWPASQQPILESYNTEVPSSAPDAAADLLERLQLKDPEPDVPQQPATPPPTKPKAKKAQKDVQVAPPESSRPEPSQPAPWQNTNKPTKSFLQIQKEEEEAGRSRAQASPEVRRYADTVVKQPTNSWGTPQRTPPVSNSSQATVSAKEKPKPKPKINPNNPPPPSDKFLNWCKLMLRGLIEVKVDDVITMLLGFPLDPPPHFKEIVQELFYEQRSKGNQQLVDSHKFAQEFVIRRKVDCGLLSADALPSPSLKPPQASSSASSTNDSFQVVSKKTRKRAN